ncbi:hypothetical protein BTU51_1075 [Rickettsia rickettsii]|uniref:Uncharacterized protein n=1 Tax=Rickettsia rickettsii (strain Iowa) TaxID=452659 RepID=B0BYE4_RICRO|nr:hypothetical protein RrIowa_1075 [Rickettsia rickettsii str. Iowa]APU55820.1 hypothetical protein BTU50_1075 [Rickettsia rickettsii]APU57197.1 hypothetical protein BTU51_1075 [Rickettsia rickettsii]
MSSIFDAVTNTVDEYKKQAAMVKFNFLYSIFVIYQTCVCP